jgi:hypothetical protein
MALSIAVSLGAALLLLGGRYIAHVSQRLSKEDSAVDKGPCTDCVVFEEFLHLGGTEESKDVLVPTNRGHVDTMGRIWLGQYRDMVKVYSSSGTYIQTVGTRGEGPGEFTHPNHFIPLADGGMLIGDPAQGRLSRFSSELTFLDSRRIPAGVSQIAELPGGEFVVNMSLATADGMGDPLHITSGDTVLRSFGSPSVGVIDPRRMTRKIATDSRGTIYSVPPDEYRITLWNQSGERLGEINGKPLQQPPKELANAEPGSRIEGIYAERGRLWVLVHELREDWRENSEEVGSGPARRLLPVDKDLANWFRARIDVFGMESGNLLASSYAPGLLAAFVGSNMAIQNRTDDVGRPTITVWRVHTNLLQ